MAELLMHRAEPRKTALMSLHPHQDCNFKPKGEHDRHLYGGDDDDSAAHVPNAPPPQFQANAEEKQHQSQVC